MNLHFNSGATKRTKAYFGGSEVNSCWFNGEKVFQKSGVPVITSFSITPAFTYSNTGVSTPATNRNRVRIGNSSVGASVRSRAQRGGASDYYVRWTYDIIGSTDLGNTVDNYENFVGRYGKTYSSSLRRRFMLMYLKRTALASLGISGTGTGRQPVFNIQNSRDGSRTVSMTSDRASQIIGTIPETITTSTGTIYDLYYSGSGTLSQMFTEYGQNINLTFTNLSNQPLNIKPATITTTPTITLDWAVSGQTSQNIVSTTPTGTVVNNAVQNHLRRLVLNMPGTDVNYNLAATNSTGTAHEIRLFVFRINANVNSFTISGYRNNPPSPGTPLSTTARLSYVVVGNPRPTITVSKPQVAAEDIGRRATFSNGAWRGTVDRTEFRNGTPRSVVFTLRAANDFSNHQATATFNVPA